MEHKNAHTRHNKENGRREALKKKGIYIISGLATGLVNGLLGAGGGMVLVPLLMWVAKLDKHKALATSVAIIAPLCVVSAAVYFLKGNALPQSVLSYIFGGLAGGTIAGLYLKKVPSVWLLRAFGALMVVSGVRMLFW